MNIKLLTIAVVALFILPSIPIAYSSDMSVVNSNNTVKVVETKVTVAEEIKDNINQELEGTGFTAETTPENPGEVHIVGPPNPDSTNPEADNHTINKPGPVDITMTLPAGKMIIISVTALSIFSSFTFSMSYEHKDFGAVECTGKMKINFGQAQYYYPEPTKSGLNPDTIHKVGRGQDYRDFGFESMSTVQFGFNGNAATDLTGLDLKIIVL